MSWRWQRVTSPGPEIISKIQPFQDQQSTKVVTQLCGTLSSPGKNRPLEYVSFSNAKFINFLQPTKITFQDLFWPMWEAEKLSRAKWPNLGAPVIILGGLIWTKCPSDNPLINEKRSTTHIYLVSLILFQILTRHLSDMCLQISKNKI